MYALSFGRRCSICGECSMMDQIFCETIMREEQFSGIVNRLWPGDDGSRLCNVYAVLDGARDDQIEPMARASKLSYDCLYNEPLTDNLRAAAPYLIELRADASFTRQLLQKGWGRSWGVFLITYPSEYSADFPPKYLATVRHSCRTINTVLGPSGQKLLFRYYDPRVMRTYLPTCNHDDLKTVFGSVKEIMIEGESGESMHHFTYGEQESWVEEYAL